MKQKQSVSYARSVPKPESESEHTYYRVSKFEGLDSALESDAEVLVIAFPEVLGDFYTEILVNLGKVAASGKTLAITKPSPFLKMDGFFEVP